jgi:NAD-dependent dihydropyrimidine dehydrogenase PreA subunit
MFLWRNNDMTKRKIVNINEELCNGCGRCIPNCIEGALQIVDGKAKIIKETYCDGLGACLGHCPQGAITIIEKEAPAFDEKEVKSHLAKTKQISSEVAKGKSEISKPQWPVKLNLIPVQAPFYESADLLVAADCAPVALKKFQESLLPGKRVVIGCPKFDDARAYAQKLGEILKLNNISKITVAHMEVPCCSGLKWAVRKAIEVSGKQIPVKEYEIKIGGEIVEL